MGTLLFVILINLFFLVIAWNATHAFQAQKRFEEETKKVRLPKEATEELSKMGSSLLMVIITVILGAVLSLFILLKGIIEL